MAPQTSSSSTQPQQKQTEAAPFFKIVLTGGPCGGKTTALARLSTYLKERGFEVGTVPEAFTLLMTNGISFEYFNTPDMPCTIQESVMTSQMALEDSMEKILRHRGKPAVLLCDRGLMDGSAYLSEAEWQGLLKRKQINSVVDIREQRYNAVFHLVTAAQGAERYYTLENNQARTETPEEARKQDACTRSAWLGHPKLYVFDNSGNTDFEAKLQRLIDAAAKLVGLPTNLQRNRKNKFLLKCPPDLSNFPVDVQYQEFDIEKVYLYDDEDLDSGFSEEYSFVRKRTYGKQNKSPQAVTFGHTTVRKIRNSNKEIEVKRIISVREYNAAIKTADPTRRVIKQTRISFLWQTQSFVVHIYNAPVNNICLLYCQVEGDGEVELPPFLDVDRVLDGPEDEWKYGSYGISLDYSRERKYSRGSLGSV
mmetsp:Transcript_7286/g.10886  ORF Transcript_7286/g.10886 Transcript_7286/m.10886 type:complete len:422 (-) Transcript_7286:53-1318(-)|eukprot:CAMPEP_0116008824 /NCGR_PEP_ID=MMETSP0321-20121206/3081_1 /TAXON_ID=163516 /ORGANISM="Leptocylindrus danicus var. danicus, Strain B650" /LENGTH=421 /DNA_ID=CAMNT_0003477697 /DNA_START=33 /DNA_END=1298 /DNA_ORIENTATION=-